MLLEAWVLAKTWSRLPSEIYKIQHPVAAWCFDRAVTHFGTQLQEDLEEHNGVPSGKEERKAKASVDRRLQQWLQDDSTEAPFLTRQFRDPMDMVPRKE